MKDGCLSFRTRLNLITMFKWEKKMTEYTRQLIYGLKPIKRENPKAGESEWYYVDPRGAESATDMKTIDVPSEFSPNPHAAEIQDYIYEHDKYNYERLYGDTPPPMSQSVENDATSIPESATNDPNCYMTFDGQNLNLYNNDGMVNTLDAQSGQDAFQSAKYQNVANKGPIPEGTYYANQDQRQNMTMKDLALKIGEKLGIHNEQKSNWSGDPISWGTSRVWLQPDENTNTYGRSGFSIHGGLNKGSAGCIDIPWQTGKLDNYLDECQDSVPVKVKYPKDW